MALILPNNSLAATAFEVTHSCNFTQASSDHMTFTPGSSGNQKIFTFSCWFKVTADTDNRTIFHAETWSATPWCLIAIDDSDYFRFQCYTAAGVNNYYVPSSTVSEGAWHHGMVAVDTTQAVAANRVKMYIDGTLVTSWAAKVDIAQDTDTGVNKNVEQQIGEEAGLGRYYNGLLAEIHMVDGTQLAVSSFAEDDGGTWTAIEYTGSHGSNGYHLDFKTASSLGDDASGNGNDFAEVNIGSGDQSTDVPPSK